MKPGIFLLLAALCLSSCSTFRGSYHDLTLAPVPGLSPDWKPIFSGVEESRIRLENPVFTATCLRVDLAADGISVLVTPRTAGVPEARGLTTGTFLERYRLQAAINATPFSPVEPWEGTPMDIHGLSISDGVTVSPAEPGDAVIVFYANGRARILELPGTVTGPAGHEPESALAPLEGAREAAAGFRLLIRDGGIPVEGQDDPPRGFSRAPRSAAGLSDRGRILYLLVIDGKNAARGVGATAYETALWLRFFGADEGLMLDGGGSASLAVEGPDGRAALLNVPVQGTIPGIERPVANHIGIRAKRLQ
jgi:hypothetical protein